MPTKHLDLFPFRLISNLSPFGDSALAFGIIRIAVKWPDNPIPWLICWFIKYLFRSIHFLQTCSQLIKAGLKLSLQAKRKTSTGDSSGGETSSCKYIKKDEDSSDDDIDSKSPKSGVSVSEPSFSHFRFVYELRVWHKFDEICFFWFVTANGRGWGSSSSETWTQ